MKATELLKTQHKEVDQLFERLEQAEGEEKRALVSELAANLVAHSTIEKQIFYPACREALGADTLFEAYEEHALVEFALQKLLSADPGDESLHAKVTVLKELVQHHVEEEQNELLKQAEGALGERNDELGMTMEEQFELIKKGDIEAVLAESLATVMPSMRIRTAPKKTARRAGAKASGSKRAGTAKRTGGAKRTGARAGAKRSTSSRATGNQSGSRKAGSTSRAGSARQGGSTSGTGKSTRSGQSTRSTKGGRRSSSASR